MEIVSFNVNGIHVAVKKGLLEFIKRQNADIYCFQEIKTTEDKFDPKIKNIPKYFSYFSYSVKKGYSGVAVYTKEKPLSTSKIGIEKFDNEGRVLILEYEKFYLINAYFPNAQHGLLRLDYKRDFNSEILTKMNYLKKKKPVILTGDFNVAHNPIDIKNPKPNEGNPGYSFEERQDFSKILSNGYIDTFRYLHPNEVKYSWWSYRFHAREKNIGWRLDYFVVNKEFMKNVKDSKILNEINGSDHCPVLLTLQL